MNYYKITNEKENHNGLQYREGLVTDSLPFNASGDCMKGGIYFAREDILAFLDYGYWLRKITIPAEEEIYENPGTPKKWKSHRVFLHPRRKIDLSVIKELIKEGANVHAGEDHALRWASKNGHLEIVKYLVKHGVDVHADEDHALRWASENGHLEIVKYLIKHGAKVRTSSDYALKNVRRQLIGNKRPLP